jgi:predicted ATP-grasp superfamily ATP-dependent carboligase
MVRDFAPPAGLLYTGALENYPEVVERLARVRPLWGNPASVLRRVRDPQELGRVLGPFYPPTRCSLAEVPQSGRWLAKPLRSGGGKGIAFLDHASTASPDRYYQEYVPGIPMAAAYRVAEGCQCRLLGVTRQLVGEGWLHASRFAYCGSVGPVPVGADVERVLSMLGDRLAEAFGLRGDFGIDWILDANHQVRVVEVNPRYTASFEVLELATLEANRPPQGQAVIGKAVLYAHSDLVFPAEGPWLADLDPARPVTHLPGFADIPLAGSRLRTGQPILTLFTRGASLAECLEQLQKKAIALDSALHAG